MNQVQAIHAQPPTLIALLLFTLISLGLGVVANLAQPQRFLPREILPGRPFARTVRRGS